MESMPGLVANMAAVTDAYNGGLNDETREEIARRLSSGCA